MFENLIEHTETVDCWMVRQTETDRQRQRGIIYKMRSAADTATVLSVICPGEKKTTTMKPKKKKKRRRTRKQRRN